VSDRERNEFLDKLFQSNLLWEEAFGSLQEPAPAEVEPLASRAPQEESFKEPPPETGTLLGGVFIGGRQPAPARSPGTDIPCTRQAASAESGQDGEPHPRDVLRGYGRIGTRPVPEKKRVQLTDHRSRRRRPEIERGSTGHRFGGWEQLQFIQANFWQKQGTHF
jgi:hypothetical protein